MPEQSVGRGGVVAIVVVAMLAALAVSQTVARFSETIGVDFYQFWGVPAALRLTGHTLGTPYADGQRYYATLREHASTSDQPKLRSAARFWGGPDPVGSPLLYPLFALTSSDFTASLRVFHVVQILAFVGGCLLLGSLSRFEPFALVALPLVCLSVYQPLLSDLRVGNLGSLQLAALAGLLALATALPRVPSFGPRAALAATLLVLLAALTLCKPNILLVSALLAVHVAVRHGPRLFAVAALPAVMAIALLLVVPCLYFGSWTVWQQWYRVVLGADPHRLVRSVAHGNYSTPLLLSSWLGGRVWPIAGLLLLLLGVSLVVAVARREARAGAPATPIARARGVVTRCFEDPRATLAIGVLLTVAASPLYWAHYYVLVLIPSVWLLSARSLPVALLAAVSVLMSAGIVGMPLWAAGWTHAMPVTIASSWAPLWAALLLALPWGEGAAPPDEGRRASRPRRRRK